MEKFSAATSSVLRSVELIVENITATSNCLALTMSGPSRMQVVTLAFLAAHAATAERIPALLREHCNGW